MLKKCKQNLLSDDSDSLHRTDPYCVNACVYIGWSSQIIIDLMPDKCNGKEQREGWKQKFWSVVSEVFFKGLTLLTIPLSRFMTRQVGTSTYFSKECGLQHQLNLGKAYCGEFLKHASLYKCFSQ